MATIIMHPGDVLKIQFMETDGEFEIHFDTDEHPNSLIVKETAGLPGSVMGAAESTLYHEQWGGAAVYTDEAEGWPEEE